MQLEELVDNFFEPLNGDINRIETPINNPAADELLRKTQYLLEKIAYFIRVEKDLIKEAEELKELDSFLLDLKDRWGTFKDGHGCGDDSVIFRFKISEISQNITDCINEISVLRTKHEYKKSLIKINELKTENKNLKTEIIGITTLIFTAFTFIQLNFKAFDVTNSLHVYDRILLFSMINISLLIPVYIIFTFIKHLMNDGHSKVKIDGLLKLKFAMCLMILIGLSFFGYYQSNLIKYPKISYEFKYSPLTYSDGVLSNKKTIEVVK